ncbi:hypothetical protein SUGI_0723440 [Cryptomeria japonica]|uniref:(Iso)eugenol O-methyltransferase n=1 Tax=Cryptomeria japonica TaxID=3369 RepID=UPI002414B9C5|nr:(Iso)eugenol O-methyltransferase [Cryptomeria japonica]GLJ36055.1 hypothetical protein SUGI_0723440 [Cryptomeria japonica]
MGSENRCAEIESTKAVLELSYLCTFPMAAKAAILLKVPDILSAETAPLTAKQIADRIPGTNTSEAKLERLLKALATYGLFEVSGSNPPVYGLTAMSRLLAKDENGVSLASLFLLNTEPSNLQTLQFLHEAVLEEGLVPFEKAYGKPVFHYFAENSQLGEIFHSAMTNLSAVSTKTVLMSYSGFKDVKVLVDVGGGTGRNCSMIKAAYPHISAINFDMPFVIAKAPKLPGIEHRGGSMFEYVPTDGDAILLKNVLHNWDDVACAKILSNCYSALPSVGKLIIIEVVLPEEIDTSVRSRLAVSFDLAMMNVFKGGKERTIPQFQDLLKSIGFKNFKVVVNEDVFSVMEAYKN